MRQALDETLNGNLNENRHCVRCGGSGIYEKFEFIHTNQFFIIPINSTFGECVPVQEFELIAGGNMKKYEL